MNYNASKSNSTGVKVKWQKAFPFSCQTHQNSTVVLVRSSLVCIMKIIVLLISSASPGLAASIYNLFLLYIANALIRREWQTPYFPWWGAV